MDFTLSPEIEDYRHRIHAFVAEHIVPLEGDAKNFDTHEMINLESLERLRAYEGLSKDRRPALESEITLLQDRFFGPEQESDATTDLHEIALKWKPAA